MRTTLNIADDVLFAAKELARRNQLSLGAVLSELARRQLRPTQAPIALLRLSIQPLRHRGGIVSNALIDRLRSNGID
jgi:hypothetical protein